jgi:general nucleoside transport system ATP-binding protein
VNRAGSVPTAPLVQLDGISKAYPGVLANDDISIDLLPGEIHSILGENGAGKTTLMGVVAGLHRPDAGRLMIRGQELAFDSPRDALAHRIGYVQQHSSLIPILTVAQNAVLALRAGGQRISVGGAADSVRRLAERYDLQVTLNVPVEELTVGEQQRAEVLNALIREPTILILDEPSALLTPHEALQLAMVLRQLADEGTSIFLISHKLEEVLSVSDRVSVLRRGRHAATVPAADATYSRLAELMIGSLQDSPVVAGGRLEPGRPRLVVEAASVMGDRGNEAVQDVSFEVGAGEVLGIAGIEGSGQVELTEALAGVRRLERGRISIDGRDVGHHGHELRIAHIPSDRLRAGLVASLTVEENLVLPVVAEPAYTRYGYLRRTAVRTRAERLVRHFDIRAGGPDVAAGTLSGGNQQKLVLARELSRKPSVIVCCYPTRGLDFAATESVQAEIASRRNDGAAIVYASVDLDELLALTDRIVVLHRGRVTGTLASSDATPEQLGMLMTGATAS